MSPVIKNRLTVLLVAKPSAVEKVAKQVEEAFILRAVQGEAVIAEVSVPRIGDLATLDGVVAVYEGATPRRVTADLSPEGTQLVTLWNWKHRVTGRPVREAAVKRVMEKLGLGIDLERNVVLDHTSDNVLGKIEQWERTEESRFFSPNPGCYWLRQACSGRSIPGVCGWWTQVRGTSEARKCTSSGDMSRTRQVVDYIRVTVWNQLGAYASRGRIRASFVAAEDWEYVWWWEFRRGGAIPDSDHYSLWQGSRIHCSL